MAKEGEEGASSGQGPTPWNQIDLKTLKVTELRDELEARKLNSKGLKSQLVSR